jgi:hypothetical protein
VVRSGKSKRKPFNSNVEDYLLIIATFAFSYPRVSARRECRVFPAPRFVPGGPVRDRFRCRSIVWVPRKPRPGVSRFSHRLIIAGKPAGPEPFSGAEKPLIAFIRELEKQVGLSLILLSEGGQSTISDRASVVHGGLSLTSSGIRTANYSVLPQPYVLKRSPRLSPNGAGGVSGRRPCDGWHWPAFQSPPSEPSPAFPALRRPLLARTHREPGDGIVPPDRWTDCAQRLGLVCIKITSVQKYKRRLGRREPRRFDQEVSRQPFAFSPSTSRRIGLIMAVCHGRGPALICGLRLDIASGI